jgi:hypothetical protein
VSIMTKRIWASLAPLFLLGCLLAAGTPQAAGEDKKAEPEAKPNEAGKNVLLIGTAFNLVEYGRKEKAPEMLIAAARILRGIPQGKEGEEKVTAEGGDAARKTSPDLVEVSDKLLAEARKMAGDDKTVLELADRVAKEKGRGAFGGPRQYTHQPGGGVNVTWNVHFIPGQLASVSVAGDGVNLLRTTVRGPGGYSYSWTGYNASTSWVVGRDGNTTINVVNLGGSPAYYTVYHN